MGKMSRDKGKEGEREVARLLRKAGFTDAKRGCQYRGGPDSPDVQGLPGVHIEVKRTERLSLYEAMEQAIQDAAPHETPALFHRKNRKPWLVVLLAKDYLELYKQAYARKEIKYENPTRIPEAHKHNA